MHKNIQRKKKEKKKKTDSDTMDSNELLPITQKEYVPHFLTLWVTDKMNRKCYVKCKVYSISESIWEDYYHNDVSDIASQNQNIIGKVFPEVLN